MCWGAWVAVPYRKVTLPSARAMQRARLEPASYALLDPNLPSSAPHSPRPQTRSTHDAERPHTDESELEQGAKEAYGDEVEVDQTFALFICLRLCGWSPTKAELAKVVKGMLGMMPFGQHDLPILLESLASLLAPKSDCALFRNLA